MTNNTSTKSSNTLFCNQRVGRYMKQKFFKLLIPMIRFARKNKQASVKAEIEYARAHNAGIGA